jgi:hypothetical protein
MDNQDKKTAIIFISFFIGVVILFIPWRDMLLKEHENTCGFIYGKHEVKGSTYFDFSYKTKSNKWLTASEDIINFKIKNINNLKKMHCIRVIYSSRFNSVAIVVDKRLKVQ